MSNPATEWLKTSEIHISDRLFQASQGLEKARTKKQLTGHNKAKAVIDTLGICPSNDLSQLGVWRVSGQCRICGDFVELYATTSHYTQGSYHKPNKNVATKDANMVESDRANSAHRSAKRAEKQVRRLVNANRLRYMWTLTLAPPSFSNNKKWATVSIKKQRSSSYVKKLFRNFVNRCNRKYVGFKWLVVYELHESKKSSDTKRGTWHIHFATDRYIRFQDMCSLWKHGISRFDDFEKPKKGVRESRVRNPGAYMSKYIGKNFDESNLHKKRYSRSRNMERPLVITLDRFFQEYPALDDLEEVYHTTRKVDHENQIYYNHNVTYRVRKSAPAHFITKGSNKGSV